MEFPSDQLGVACLGCRVLEILVFAYLGCPRRNFFGETLSQVRVRSL